MLNWLLKPTTDAPSRAAKTVANQVDKPLSGFRPDQLGGYGEQVNKLGAQFRGGLAGMVEGAGNLASDMTSPLSIASMGLGRAASGAARGARSIAPTMDLIEEAPAIKQVMPQADDVGSLIGDMQRNLARIPQGGSRLNFPGGIPPSMLPAEMAPVGSEAAFNAPSMARAAQNSINLGDIAEEGSRVAGKRRMPAGNLGADELANLMASLAKARGR